MVSYRRDRRPASERRRAVTGAEKGLHKMTREDKRRLVNQLLGAEPIPDEALARYAALADSLTDAVRVLARELTPEDEAGGFLVYLEHLAETSDGN